MNGSSFFDTNVLVYVVGQHDERTAPAEALVAGGGVVSVQVLNELVSVARRKLGMTWEEIAEALAAIRTLCPSPVPLTVNTHESALRIAAQHGYHIYDALVVAAAIEGDCTTLYSEDLQDGQVIDECLTIRNPFATWLHFADDHGGSSPGLDGHRNENHLCFAGTFGRGERI